MMKTNVLELITTLNIFMIKCGSSTEIRTSLRNVINNLLESSNCSLKNIYVNDDDNTLMPDVLILPVYHSELGINILLKKDPNQFHNGYTIEIHKRCFTKYTAQELAALLVHDILQNIISTVSISRLLTAYTTAISKYKDKELVNMFESMSQSQVIYVLLLDICMRPFEVPAKTSDIVATDEVLVAMGLDEYYNRALVKKLDMSLKTVDDIIQCEVDKDAHAAKVILRSCFTNDINSYYMILKNALKSITINNLLRQPEMAKIGFTINESAVSIINEASFRTSTTKTEIQYELDKIATAMKYIDHEDERAALLWDIKHMTIKLNKLLNDVENKQKRIQSSGKYAPEYKDNEEKIAFIVSTLNELDELRKVIVKLEIKPKRYGVFIQYPAGYDY